MSPLKKWLISSDTVKTIHLCLHQHCNVRDIFAAGFFAPWTTLKPTRILPWHDLKPSGLGYETMHKPILAPIYLNETKTCWIINRLQSFTAVVVSCVRGATLNQRVQMVDRSWGAIVRVTMKRDKAKCNTVKLYRKLIVNVSNKPLEKWKDCLFRPDYLERNETFFLFISSGNEKSRPLGHEISPVDRYGTTCGGSFCKQLP